MEFSLTGVLSGSVSFFRGLSHVLCRLGSLPEEFPVCGRVSQSLGELQRASHLGTWWVVARGSLVGWPLPTLLPLWRGDWGRHSVSCLGPLQAGC